jgi:hypothetical protein
MTMRIGPIELENPQIQAPNRQKVSDYFKPIVNKDNLVYTPVGQVPTSYSVKLAVPTHIYKQIEGISEWTAPYPIVLDELSQDMLGISGWGFIGNVKLEDNQNPETVIMSCDVAIIELDENTFLKMDYTTGKESGTVIEKTYPDTVDESLFSDLFAGTLVDTNNNWDAQITGNFSGTGITIDTNRLKLSGTTTSGGKRGTVFMTSQECFKAPFKMDFDMDWSKFATRNSYEMRVMFCPEKPVSIDDYLTNDFVCAYLYSKSTYCNLHFSAKIDGKASKELVTYDGLTNGSENTPRIRFEVQSNGKLTIYKNTDGSKDSSGNYIYTQVWGASNPGWDFDEGLYVVVGFSNWNNATETVYCQDISLYTTINTTPQNVVPVPPGATLIDTDHPFYRDTEEGRIYLYKNPSDIIPLQLSFDEWDNGSIKVFNSNNESSEYRRVYNDENVFTPTSWYASNGLIQLSTDNSNINFKYWQKNYYTNLCPSTLATGGNDGGSASNITKSYSPTVTISTDWGYLGSNSIKVTPIGTQNNEGVTSGSQSVTPGQNYVAQVVLHGTAGKQYCIYMQMDTTPYTSFFTPTYQLVTLTGGVDTFTFVGTCPTGVTSARVVISTNTTGDTTPFYVGKVIWFNGTSIPDTVMNLDDGDLGEWTLLDQFQLSKSGVIQPISYVKPLFINSERCIIQINDTYWWLLRGKQHVIINHTGTDIAYTKKTYYNVGKTVYTPGTGDQVNMTSAFYCNVYNSTDVYMLQIVQAVPTKILSNLIPSTEYTGMGWFNSNLDPDSNSNGYVMLAREFFNVVDTKITK